MATNATSSSRPQGFKSQYPRKERPLCTHCRLLGHTVEKCYKLHGYPPKYKFTKGKHTPSANQVSDSSLPQVPFTTEQYQQLLSLLRTKTADEGSFVPPASIDNQDHLFSKMAGDNSSSYCFSSVIHHSTPEAKHSVFSSHSLFQLAIKNSSKYP
jgi:hypothetical protein